MLFFWDPTSSLSPKRSSSKSSVKREGCHALDGHDRLDNNSIDFVPLGKQNRILTEAG